MPTTYGEYVVCGLHEMLYPASSRCPECPDHASRGVAETPNQRVRIVQRPRADGGER